MIHIRDALKPTKAWCGLGYDYPSTIALRPLNHPEIDCKDCKDKFEKAKREMGAHFSESGFTPGGNE